MVGAPLWWGADLTKRHFCWRLAEEAHACPALPPSPRRKPEDGTAVIQQFQRGQPTLSFLEKA